MANYNAAVMTNGGADLLAKSIAEEFNIEFVKMETGSGEYSDDERTKESLGLRTALKDVRQNFGFSSISATMQNAVKLKALISNENLLQGYRMTEIGIWAKKKGAADTDAVLYSICIAEEADFIPAKESPVEIIHEYFTMVKNAENVTISIEMGTVALAVDLEAVRYPEYQESDTLSEIESGESIFLVFGKIKKAIKELINHISNKSNPHAVTKSQIGLGNVDNTSDMSKPVSELQQEALDLTYQQSTGYTDQKIADLINGAPETLDTLKEIADAMAENQSVVEALDAAIGSKANEAEFESHTGNSTIHVTATEKEKWNNKLEKTDDTADNTTTFTSADSTSPTAWTDVAVLTSGEKLSSLFNKISTMFKNVRWLYKMLGATDISAIGGGTVTGALAAINTDLNKKVENSFTASRALVSNSSCNVAVSAVTATELGYLSGTTKNIQAQFDATNSYFFGGRTYMSYVDNYIFSKVISLPDAFKTKDVNNYYVVVTLEQDNTKKTYVPFVNKETGCFSVNVRDLDGSFTSGVAIWFNYVVIIRH